jgi:hypothetical protein
MDLKKLFSVLLISSLCIFSGCLNPYGQYYTDHTGGANILENPNIIVSTDEPKLIQGSNVENDGIRMLEDGYLLIGVSSFNAANVNQKSAIEQAKKVHADTVIVYSQYTNTVSGSMPVTVPNTQTTYHSGNIYGSRGGFANYSGTSTTYGTQTTYVTYSIMRYDYLATYWVKIKLPRLGIHFEDLTDELRKKVESNKGVYIIAVIKGSPAFNADLLKGDIIRKLNNIEIIDKNHLINLIAENKEQRIELEIFRNEKTIIKQVQLN